MEILNHCYKNAKKRCGLNKSSFEKLVNNAKELGISVHKTKGSLKKWIQSRTLDHKFIFSVWVYDKYLILYNKDVVISVYQIPQRFLPTSNYIKKEK